MTYLDPIDFAASEFGDLYDELPLWSAPFGLWLLDRVPVKPGLTILDIGAGTGFIALELAERCGPASRVIAVDPWAAGMGRLRRKIEPRRLTNIQLLEQDAAALDLPAESVDVIVSNLGVNNFDDPGAVLRLCSRIAKPGASFLLTTNTVGHMAEFYEVYRQVLVDTGQADRIAVLEAHINHRATTGSVTQLLESAGFKIADVVTDSFRLRFADGSALLRHYFVRLAFVQGWKEVATVGLVEQTFDRLERALNAAAAERGELALTIPMACFSARKAARERPMHLPAAIAEYWERFNLAAGGVDPARFYEAFFFGDSEALASALAELVLEGKKRATTGSLWSFEHEGKPVPRPGDFSVVTSWAGAPLCVIETMQVEVLPFNEVTAEFAAVEGEGDGSLDDWRHGHAAYFERECARAGRAFDEGMLVVCERFRVVFTADA